MTLLVTLAETVPTTLTGALVVGVTGLASAVVWLATRLLTAHTAHTAVLVERAKLHAEALAAKDLALAAKDLAHAEALAAKDKTHAEAMASKDRAHAEALARVHEERTEEVRALTEAATALREHGEILRDHAAAHATGSRRSR